MSKTKITAALKGMDKALADYEKSEKNLNTIINDLCGGSISDIVNDDEERQDALLSFTDGISASANDILSWCNEFKEAQDDD